MAWYAKMAVAGVLMIIPTPGQDRELNVYDSGSPDMANES